LISVLQPELALVLALVLALALALALAVGQPHLAMPERRYLPGTVVVTSTCAELARAAGEAATHRAPCWCSEAHLASISPTLALSTCHLTSTSNSNPASKANSQQPTATATPHLST
jgi:hypothetical protein